MTATGEHQTHKPKSETEEWKNERACTTEQAEEAQRWFELVTR